MSERRRQELPRANEAVLIDARRPSITEPVSVGPAEEAKKSEGDLVSQHSADLLEHGTAAARMPQNRRALAGTARDAGSQESVT